MWRKSDLHSVCGPEKAQKPEDARIIILSGAEEKWDEALERREGAFQESGALECKACSGSDTFRGTQRPSALLAVSALPAWARKASRRSQSPLSGSSPPTVRMQEMFSRFEWPVANHWKGNSRNAVWLPGVNRANAHVGGGQGKMALFTGGDDMPGPKVKVSLGWSSDKRRKHGCSHTAMKGSLVSLEATRLKGIFSQQNR